MFQFRLRTLFIVTAVAAVASALAARAGPDFVLLLAAAAAGLLIGTAGVLATEWARKRARGLWIWAALLMGVGSVMCLLVGMFCSFAFTIGAPFEIVRSIIFGH